MRVARRRTKRSWRTRANGLNSGQDKKCPGSSNIRPEQRQILGRVSDGGRPRRSRDARLNSRSDKERDEEGRARSQAREEGARQAEKEEEETGELDRRSFRSEKTAFSTGEQSAEGRGEEQRS